MPQFKVVFIEDSFATNIPSDCKKSRKLGYIGMQSDLWVSAMHGVAL